jgi:hypothetical protein
MIQLPGWVSVALLALTVMRIAAALWAALSNTRGDYYASLPGAYVQHVNPVLWDSPDMVGARGYHVNTYFHGPAQYLTLYAMAYLDSYAEIAKVLMPIYVVVLAGAFVLLRATIVRLAGTKGIAVPLFAATFLFFPLLQAFIQREFEVVVFFALTAALWLLVHERKSIAGAILGYVAWFKYVPLLFLGYLALRRWYKAMAAFAAASAVVLLVSDALFGLELFVNNNVPTHAAQVFNLWSYGFQPGPHGYLAGTGFCYGWLEIETTLANVRHGLCSLAFTTPWLPPHLVYLTLCAAIAASYVVTHVRLERAAERSPDDERWRRALECSIVISVCTCFFFNHYYYLIVLVIPLSVLLARYWRTPNPVRLAAWAVAYLLLSAFVVPTSVLARVAGTDVWAVYIKGAWFLGGELLLMFLLLLEYWGAASRRTQSTCTAPRTGSRSTDTAPMATDAYIR